MSVNYKKNLFSAYQKKIMNSGSSSYYEDFGSKILILTYLLQNNYPDTAISFAKTSGLYALAFEKPDIFPQYLLESPKSNCYTLNHAEINTLVKGTEKESNQEDRYSLLKLKKSKLSKPINPYDLTSAKNLYTERPKINFIDKQVLYLKIRKEIYNAVLNIDINNAFDLMLKYFPEMFKLPKLILEYQDDIKALDLTKLKYSDSLKFFITQPAIPFENNIKYMLLRHSIDSFTFIELITKSMFNDAAIFSNTVLRHYQELVNMWISNVKIYAKPSPGLNKLINENKRLFVCRVLTFAELKSKNNVSPFSFKTKYDSFDGLDSINSDCIDGKLSGYSDIEQSDPVKCIENISEESMNFKTILTPMNCVMSDELYYIKGFIKINFQKSVEMLTITSMSQDTADELYNFTKSNLANIIDQNILAFKVPNQASHYYNYKPASDATEDNQNAIQKQFRRRNQRDTAGLD
ncbi:hypothetical protein BB561_001624 [Smittium simulii]|uniref:LisH domain-containing protein n=1 Tax=Smittium simulii TaxID=133385 RepID=A0A2T9YTS9_9FUNG|nr:hypothetical protein BB561_001624 [Smittium simulii]